MSKIEKALQDKIGERERTRRQVVRIVDAGIRVVEVVGEQHPRHVGARVLGYPQAGVRIGERGQAGGSMVRDDAVDEAHVRIP